MLLVLQLIFSASTTQAKTIKGAFYLLPNTEIRLMGFDGFKTNLIAQTQTDDLGNFTISYTTLEYSVGYLIANDNKPLLLMLTDENIELTGEALSAIETLNTTKGEENLFFAQYVKEQAEREQALAGWFYLEKIYKSNSVSFALPATLQSIVQEKVRLKTLEASFLSSLPKNSFVSWYLPVRKLISTVGTIAQYRTEEIPAAISAFRALNYVDERLYKSGLLKDAIDSHFWLLENSGLSLDSVYLEMQISIDNMLSQLFTQEAKLNEITDYLFDLLEKRSLFEASEYLALKVLNEVNCTISSDLSKQLETYRAMKKGNTAPNLVFPKTTLYPNANFRPTQLAEIKSPYTVVVFGASWCPKCKEELPKIAQQYEEWKKNGVEVVFVSLDETEFDFINFASVFPFISLCDYQKWDSPMAQDFYVFSTPTMYLLDADRTIILRPKSVQQMSAWVDWYRVKGNPLPLMHE